MANVLLKLKYLSLYIQIYTTITTNNNKLLLKMNFSQNALVAASDELMHTLNTANIYLFKVNNRRYEICSINKDTKTTSNEVVTLSSLVTLNRFQTLVLRFYC